MLSTLLSLAVAVTPTTRVAGEYLEIRTCDVYTGPCYANSECGIVGREAALAWKVGTGQVAGVDVSGLSVVALLRSNATFGNPYEVATNVRSVLLIDEKADGAQRAALEAFVKAQIAPMKASVESTHVVAIGLETGCCDNRGCATLTGGAYVNATTRCVHEGDKHCGNESIFYPPLQPVTGVTPAVAETFSIATDELDTHFTEIDRRGAFTAQFTMNGMVPVTIANLPAESATAAAAAPETGKDEFKLAKLDTARGDDAKKRETAIPEEVPEAFKKLLAQDGLRLTIKKDGEEKPLYDLWLCSEIAIGDVVENRAIQFSQIPVTTFVGVLRSFDRGNDYRDVPIPKGVYVLRYGYQPQDGNHLGTAPTRDFFVLTTFAEDKDPAALKDMKALEDTGLASAAGDHPMVLYLERPEVESTGAPQFYKHTEREEWIADVTVPGRAKDAKETTNVRIGIVLVGKTTHQ